MIVEDIKPNLCWRQNSGDTFLEPFLEFLQHKMQLGSIYDNLHSHLLYDLEGMGTIYGPSHWYI